MASVAIRWRRGSRAFALVAFAASVLAACGGTTYVYETPQPNFPTPTPTSQPTGMASATVSFNVIVPNISGSVRVRPHAIVPAASQSVTIALDSVNGTTPTTPTPPLMVNLSAATSGCEQSSTQLSCVINVSAPVGALIYTLTVYAGPNGTGGSLGAGNLAVTTTAGSTVVAPATLTGTVAKVIVTVGVAPLGAPTSVPVTVQAEDTSSNTVLGTYTNPITLADTDASGQTTLSSSATNITTGATVVTLAYAGGAMSSPATINASATNVSPANVTAGSFAPIQTYPTVNGSSTDFTYTQSLMYGYNGPPVNGPNTSGGNFSAVVTTGQTFDGITNLIQIAGLQSGAAGLPYAFQQAFAFPDLVAYYAWAPLGSQSSLGLVGMTGTGYYTLTCAAPYMQLMNVPLSANWDVRAGSAPCTAEYSNPILGGQAILHADGSYTDESQGAGEAFSLAVNSDGSVTQTENGTCGCGSSIIAIGVPSPGAATVPVAIQTFPGAIPSPGSTTTPSPVQTSVPNPWALDGTSIPGNKIPNPLESDTFTVVGQIGALPSQCAIPAGLLGTNPTLTEADETVILADPAVDYNQMYYSNQVIKHYYLNGVGEICNETTLIGAAYQASFDNYYTNLPTNPNYNTTYTTYLGTQWTYLTSTTLMATNARRREAAQAFSAATYALAHVPFGVTKQWTDRHRFVRKP